MRNEVELLKIWHWKRVRIKILTNINNFTFYDYHNIYRRNIKWFYICTIWKWKCFCCDEKIQKKNAVLVKVYCYEFQKCYFMFLNYFYVEEIKKAMIWWNDPMLKNDFVVWRNNEIKWWDFFFFRTKNNSMNDFHRENIKNDKTMSLNRAYDFISLPLDSIKQAFYDEFKFIEEKENEYKRKQWSHVEEEVEKTFSWSSSDIRYDWLKRLSFWNDDKELSIHKVDTSVVESQFQKIESIEDRIKTLKKL